MTLNQQMRDRVMRAVKAQLAVQVPLRMSVDRIITIVAEDMHVQRWRVERALQHNKPRGRQRKQRCQHCQGTGYKP